jgi:hypothetical protein
MNDSEKKGKKALNEMKRGNGKKMGSEEIKSSGN